MKLLRVNRSARGWILLVSLLVSLASPVSLHGQVAPGAAKSTKANTAAPAAVDAIVREAMAAGPIVGLSVAASRGGQILFSAAYGHADLENEVLTTPTTIYQLGSITKAFTATAVMQLVDAGKIKLEDELTRFLPGYPLQGQRVTIHHLLNHTSGIKNYLMIPRWQDAVRLDLTHEQLVGLFRQEPFDFTPGARFSYTNSGYYLLGLIIEKVAGVRYPAYLKTHIFDLIGMASATYCEHRPVIKGRARGYDVPDGIVLNAEYFSMKIKSVRANASCRESMRVKWVRALADGRLVSKESFRRMTTPGTLTDGTRIEYGYGLASSYLEGHARIGHIGGIRGFASQFAYYPDDDLVIVVLTNTENAKAATIETQIARALLRLPEQVPPKLALSKQALDRYTGTYDLGLALVAVSESDGKLLANATSVLGNERYNLTAQGDHRFVADEDSEVRLTFELRGDKAHRIVIYRKGITMRADRIE